MEVPVLMCVSVLGLVSGSCPSGTYGYECRYQCHCPLDKCSAVHGCSPEDCNTGWSGLTCNKGNIALNKSTSASSVYDYGDPGNAVDGDNSADNNYKCFQSDWTDNSITEAWWRVDLEEMVRIRHATIYFRTSYKVHRNGIQMYIADTTASPTDGVNCYNVTGNSDGTDIPDVLKVTCSGEGRYLVLYTTTVNYGFVNVPLMDFCEVEVDVCSNGTFGADCDSYCHCDGEVCDYVDGICPSGVCLPGWTTERCDTACEFGHYGTSCRMSCQKRHCKGDNSSCDRVTGRCDGGCETGWNGTDCTLKCLRSYGDGCSKLCSDRKCAESSSDTCDHVSGRCDDGCRGGWKGTDCTEEAPDDDTISPLSVGLLGGLAMLVSMAVVMGGVCLWRRTQHRKKSSTGENVEGLPPSPPTSASDSDATCASQYATLEGRSPDMYESLNVSGGYSSC